MSIIYHVCSKMLCDNVLHIMYCVLATRHHFLARFTKFSRIWSSYSLT
nr:MAG TPA: hypothetical protein [Caudoviricetes sp.]DAW00200.1 MAG TPA: hypothetical protein [Caudoviricetes sp.]